MEKQDFGYGIKNREEAEERQKDLIIETNGAFAEIGHCGEDQLACGVCTECEEAR